MKRSEFTADEWGAKMCRAYDEYAEHHKAGRLDDDAPKAHEILNQLISANKAARDAASGELERTDRSEPTGDDPTPHTPGTPMPPDRPGGALQSGQDRGIAGYGRLAADGQTRRESPSQVYRDEDGIVHAPRLW